MMNVPLYKVDGKIRHYKINIFVNLKRRPHVDHVSGVVHLLNKRFISNN